MNLEFHRVFFVLLFALFGSLSALGFDHITKSQQRMQKQIQKVEKRLQQLPRLHKFDLKRLSLLCELSDAYGKVNRPTTSKALRASIGKLFNQIKHTQQVNELPPKVVSCTAKASS